MPNAADIKPAEHTSFLLIGDGGTHKTWFIGTCPQPSYTFDLDAGMGIHAGRADMDYDTFKELPRGEIPTDRQRREGFYEWGLAWPAILNKINEIGKRMDEAEKAGQPLPYKTLAFDSLTLLTDVALTFVLRSNSGPSNPTGVFKDGRQMWQPILNNMSALFSQFTGWQVTKVLTAHVKRDENPLSDNVEKLPLVPGQFAGKVGVYFDEVYYTESFTDSRGTSFTSKCQQDGTLKMAKSRKFNLKNGFTTDFREIVKLIEARK